MTFKPDWKTTLAVAIMLPILVTLGFWQLSRAEEKLLINNDWQRKRAADPAPLTAETHRFDDVRLAWLRLRLQGHYLQDRDFLLDNRLRGGRFGYEVLTPFQLADSDDMLLVNRGWLPGDPARRSLPAVPGVAGLVNIVATVYVPPGDPYLLSTQQLQPGWPKVLQAIDIPLMAQGLQEQLFSRSVRIDWDAPGALQAEWAVVNVSPEKHTGYAVQWFAMALVLSILYLVRSIERAPRSEERES